MIEVMAILLVHIVPHAKDDVVIGEHGGAIKIKLRAPAREGKANAALMRFSPSNCKCPGKPSCWNAVGHRATN